MKKKDFLKLCLLCSEVFIDETKNNNKVYCNQKCKSKHYTQKYYNSEHNKKRRQEYRKENIHIYRERYKNWVLNNKERKQQINKKWSQKNKDIINSLSRKYYRKNKLRFAISNSIRKVIRKKHNTSTYLKMFGYTIEQLKIHLEKNFVNGMSWENYGKWHIDHIKPQSLFNLNNTKELIECWSLSNLQPLWAVDNCRKGNKYV